MITAACGLAVAATPHFLSLYPYPFQTEGSVAQQRLIVEWFSPDFHQVFLRPFEAMVFLLLAGFALRRPTLYEFLLVAIALFTLALCCDATAIEAAEIANHASAVVVGKVGTATVTREELVASFQNDGAA